MDSAPTHNNMVQQSPRPHKRPREEEETRSSFLPPVPPPHFEQGYLERPLPSQSEVAGEDGLASESSVAQFRREGFVVIRGLLTRKEVSSSIEELQHICDQWNAGERPGQGLASEAPITPLVDFDPDLVAGRRPMTAEPIDAVRRFFRLAVHNDYFRQLTQLPKILAPLKALWGENIAVLQSMALCKPPGAGEKRWHADNGYFRLRPSKVAAFWIALDATDVHNGCMYVCPASHRNGTAPHGVPSTAIDGRSMMEHPTVHIFYSTEKPPLDQVLAIPMAPGDALLFDGDLLHYTPPNRSSSRRRALQFHYAAAECGPTVCRGNGATKAVNEVYGAIPKQGFDCAPESQERCVEPQYWYYRKAEVMACGVQGGEACI